MLEPTEPATQGPATSPIFATAEAQQLAHSLRVFGHFDEPTTAALCRGTETRVLDPGEYLFRIGDKDDSLYVVSKGAVQLLVADPVDTDILLNEFGPGDTLTSLLRFVTSACRNVLQFLDWPCLTRPAGCLPQCRGRSSRFRLALSNRLRASNRTGRHAPAAPVGEPVPY